MIKDLHLLESALRAGGLMPDTITAGNLQRCKAEGDRGSKRSGAYRLFDDEIPTCIWWNWKTSDTGIWVSNERPLSDADRNRHRQLIEQAKRERQQEQARQWAASRVKLLALWESAAAITDSDPAGRYLINRGLTIPHTGVLRYHAGLDYWHEGQRIGQFPAMLAAITSPQRELITIHRTFITPDGEKAPVPTVKKLCSPAGLMGGASIKIGTPTTRPDGRVALGIAEGIETSLAAAILFGVPVWAGVSAHGLTSFTPPPSVRNVYVFADNDASQTGQKAAAQLAERLTRQGFAVRIHTPPITGNDWADELEAREATI